MLTLQGWISILVTLAIFVGLQRRRGAPVDLLFLGGLVAVTLAGVITPTQALAGFANSAVLTIGALFVVAAGLRATGVLDWVGQQLLGKVHTERGALARLTFSVAPVSAFLLNTPLVAMMMPVVIDWCRKRGVSPSRLLIPLSYLTIVGGVCTLIGTSTTLVVNAWLKDQHVGDNADALWNAPFRDQLAGMGLFELGKAGLPCAVIAIIFLLLVARRLLPNRTELVEQLGDKRREYLVEMLVQPGCPLVGRSIEDAGLRHLPGLFLIEIDREGEVITPVAPHDLVHEGDRMIFTGVVTTIVDLEKIPGLVPAADLHYEFHPHKRQQRHLVEAVLSRTSPLIGRTVRQANFREQYNAAIVAVHRNGVRLTNKIGNITLDAGDTLLLQTRSDFVASHRHNREFYLVSEVGEASPRRHDRAILAGILFLVLIVWLSVGNWLRGYPDLQGFSSSAVAAIAIAGLLVVTKCLSINRARSAIDLQVLITIAAALGVGKALETSGAAQAIAEMLVHVVRVRLGISEEWLPYVLLALVYLLTMVFTEMITNVAVAATLLPIAVGVAWEAQLNPRPFVMAIALAASLSFLTPIGYQTNLMVMGPGGYRPRDFLKVGLPLALLMWITATIAVSFAWSFKL